MRLLKETYSVDASEADYIQIQVRRVVDSLVGPLEMGGPLWFEREKLAWIVEQLKSRLSCPRLPDAQFKEGRDDLWVCEEGPEPDPGIGIDNQRPGDAPHGGTFAIYMSMETASRLLAELTKVSTRETP